MRRILPFVLVGLGVFLVALAFLVRLYVYPSAAVLPYELGDAEKGVKGQQSTATGRVSVLDKGLIAEEGRNAVRPDVPVTAIRTLVTDLSAPESQEGGDVTVWRVGLAVIDDKSPADKPKLITDAMRQSVCLDRSTSESVSPCSRSYVVTCNQSEKELDPCKLAETGEAPARPQAGQQFKFPFGTEKKTYKYYDTTILQATDVRFEAEEEMNGLTVYRFVQEIPETMIEDLKDPPDQVPGILFDPKLKKNVPAKQYYQAENTYWVEPESGQIIKGQSTSQQVLRGPAGTEELVVFDGTLTMIDEDVKANAEEAASNRSKLRLVRLWVPIGAGVLGGLLVGAGLMLELGYRRRARLDANAFAADPADPADPADAAGEGRHRS
ncbi:MAG: DUF3068 domain-containing protein [Thermocrispum sp.]